MTGEADGTGEKSEIGGKLKMKKGPDLGWGGAECLFVNPGGW